ncbi:sugar phosphate nucleotidyltransferase [Rhizobium sp. 18065]|uniref:mannose-1-phosphate guanylyltransferase n=1 Tax=Rhizobium sp. 18065 TaxID=2681411 RepID=UPI00135CD452|nr:sugar phosphate nucleotidyltransferase [Rhizobium sp. 18065]
MQNVHPLILCGGIGTRLWPLSRTEHPKQFQRIDGNSETTFFHATVERHRMPGFADPIVAVSSSHVATVLRQLNDLNCPARIIAEPISRNTGPAVLATALDLAETDPAALICVIPSDHIVKGDLTANVLAARAAAESGHIVLFGVPPEYPETGYGYIVDGGALDTLDCARKVASFIEKPPVEIATSLIKAGNAYWASGISLFRADVLISEFQRLDPITYEAVSNAIKLGLQTEHALYLNAEALFSAANLPTESIVFEHSPRTVIAPLHVAWSDVGAWNALHHIAEKDEDGNVLSGDVISIDTCNSYIRSTNKLVAVIGMQDVVVVDTDDALLITTRDQAQQVKQIVKKLETIKRRELAEHARNQMAWGEIRRVQSGPGYELRMMTLRAGGMLPMLEDLASHRMLTVTNGSGLLKNGAITRHLHVGDTFEVPPGESTVIFCGPEAEMQLVEVVCEVVTAKLEPQAGSRQLVNS